MKKVLPLLFVCALVGCGKKVKIDYAPAGGGNNNAPLAQTVQLGAGKVAGSNASANFQLTPDGSKIVYLADEDFDEVQELYVVNRDGTGHRKLHPSFTSLQDVRSFKISPDSSRVAFLADLNTDEAFDLFSVKLDGTQFVQLNSNLGSSAKQVGKYEWSAGSQTVVYASDESDTQGTFGLYASDALGNSGRLVLESNAATARPLTDPNFQLSPNGQRAVYRVLPSSPLLRAISVDGQGGSYLLSSQIASVNSFSISPDSSKVAYLSVQDGAVSYELYTVNLTDGLGRVKVSSAATQGNVYAGLFSGTELVFPGYRFTPDSSRVVYLAGSEPFFSLYAGSVTGPNENGVLVSQSGTISRLFLVPSNNTALYLTARELGQGAVELFSVNLTSLQTTKVNSPIVVGETVHSAVVAGDKVLYAAARNGKNRLFVNNLSGGQEVELTPQTFTGQGIGIQFNTQPFMLTMNADKAVFRASLDSADYNLYSVNLDGSDLKQINPSVSGKSVPVVTAPGVTFLIKDGRVIYRAQDASSVNLNLYSSAL